MMMTMNGTDVASLQPVSKKARKRPRIASVPPPSNYSPSSSSSPSSRITKANKSKRYGSRLSLSSSSSSPLANFSFRKRESTAADVTAAASISPTETRVEPEVFRLSFPEIKWECSVPPDPPNYNGELTASEPRDHFALSSTAIPPPPQTLGSNVYNWPSSSSGLLPFNSPLFPMCHQPVSYLPAHENLPHENSSRNCLVGFPGVTTHPYSAYPLQQSFESAIQPRLTPEDQPYLGDNTPGRGPQSFGPDSTCLPRADGNGMDNQDEGWLMVNPEQPVNQQPTVDGDFYNEPAHVATYQEVGAASVYNSQVQAPDFRQGGTEKLEENPWECIGPQIVDEIAADSSGPPSRPERRPRSHLTAEARTQTSKTRKLKACIRCRMQKIRCEADPECDGGDCLKCLNVNPESKKVVHRLPCLRWKLAEIVLYRDGGLGLTKRWSGVKMKDLAPRDWADDKIRKITVNIGCRKAPLVLSVRRFTPNSGDVTWKYWVDAQRIRRRFDIEPYALANIWETADQYSKYVTNFALIAVAEYAEDPDHHVDGLVRRTYNEALDCHRNLIRSMLFHKGDEVNHLQFLTQYFCLWFAMRNMLGSAIIVGEDKLDMEPVDDETCPYHGMVFIPRMIPAQFDSIGHVVVLSTLRKLVLEGLWKMMASTNPRDFFVVYITVFMLLHEVSITSRDRFRRARDHNFDASRRYDLERFVEHHQEGANIILSHWHYYKRNFYEMKNAENMEAREKEKMLWGKLEPKETQLILETWQACEEQGHRRMTPLEWEDDLYFVSQMFEENWKPGPTFTS